MVTIWRLTRLPRGKHLELGAILSNHRPPPGRGHHDDHDGDDDDGIGHGQSLLEVPFLRWKWTWCAYFRAEHNRRNLRFDFSCGGVIVIYSNCCHLPPILNITPAILTSILFQWWWWWRWWWCWWWWRCSWNNDPSPPRPPCPRKTVHQLCPASFELSTTIMCFVTWQNHFQNADFHRNFRDGL